MLQASIQTKIDQMARVAVGAEPSDLNALVELGELAGELADALIVSDLDALSLLAKRVKEGVESIVLRESDSPEDVLREAHKTIDELQRACASVGASPESAAGAGPASNSAVDAALLSAWITSCDGMLGELEALLLVVEREPKDAEAQAEIRRIVHTLKGECGVLALHNVQGLCHEAETLMDKRSTAGEAPAVDVLLELVDWLKNCIAALAVNPNADTGGHEKLLAKIVAAQGVESAAGAEATTATETGAEAETIASVAAEPAGVAEAVEEEASAAVVKRAATTGTSEHADATEAGDPLAYTVAAGSEDNIADFLCEAREHIAGAEEALLALDHDSTNRELINTVFRAFHTIKGVSGFLHLTPLVALSHRAEQLLDGARSGTILLGRREMDVILASCDMLLKLLVMVGGGAAPLRTDFDALLRNLDAASSGTGSGSEQPAAAAASEAKEHPAAVAAAQAAADTAEKKGAEAAPAAKESGGAAAPQAGNTVKRADQTVKVSTSRMDNLVTMVGELVIAQQMVVQDATSLGAAGQRVQRTLSHVQKIVRDLQEISMALRMVSLKSTFQRMNRLVRDVAVKAGKEIACITEGEDVELDRNVVDEITDPLVHMIRNACDHGLEQTNDRIAAGKSKVGHVFLKAYHSGGSIVIEIGDDGRGLRREKIIAKAKANGLIPAETDEAGLLDSDVFGYIFLPGFSTADKVTDISGRGVGMDVVRRNIEALRGKIEIKSTPGQGTTFLLRLPLTMAIIDGMVVRVGEQRYVLPTLSVEHAFRPTDADVSTVVGKGEMVNVRGRLLPIYRLGRVLGLEEGSREMSEGLFVVVESATSRCALLVDEILGQQQVVIKNLGSAGAGLHGVAGGAILGDGRVALILDVGSIVAEAAKAG